MFPLSNATHEEPGLDPDLRHLLLVNSAGWSENLNIFRLFMIEPELTPSHIQWVSDTLLQYSWVPRSKTDDEVVKGWICDDTAGKIPPNARLSRLLAWCIFLDSPPAEEALKVQNKSYDTLCFVLQITHSTVY